MQGDGRLRTTPGEKRVSARRGRAGEKGDFFSILIEDWTITEGQDQSQPAARKRDGGGRRRPKYETGIGYA